MDLATFGSLVDGLFAELSDCRGYRTLWIDTLGGVQHCEPEVEGEAWGWRQIVTLRNPNRDELAAELLRVLQPSSSVAAGAPRFRGARATLLPVSLIGA
jgi:hypothetical protein